MSAGGDRYHDLITLRIERRDLARYCKTLQMAVEHVMIAIKHGPDGAAKDFLRRLLWDLACIGNRFEGALGGKDA